MVRVRFAPSPTGRMHVGNLRSGLYDELFALRHGGVFVLRIEDTDRTRLVENGVESIVSILDAVGIVPQEGPYLAEDGTIKERGEYGPYVQSARLPIYAEHAEKLLASGHAYHCFCTPERLEEVKAAQAATKQPVMYDKHCRNLSAQEAEKKKAEAGKWVIRLKIPESGTTAFDDLVRGHVEFENVLVDDQVLVKSDGFPTYHLANVVDDHLMKITHVIRGEEWLPSTPKHIMLYRAFGWEPPVFAHLPLLLNPDRSKLSKRQGDVAAEDYLEKGYLPEALVNFMALLGWNPSGDREIYAKEELAKEFDLTRVNKAGAVFNREKLDWMNREYLKSVSDDRLYELAAPHLAKAGIDLAAFGKEYVVRALALERSRVTVLSEFPEALSFMFAGQPEYPAAMLVGKKSDAATAKARLQGLVAALESYADADFSSPDTLKAKLSELIAASGWTNADTLWPMRVALSGREQSPGPFEIAWALGKDKTLARLRAAAEMV